VYGIDAYYVSAVDTFESVFGETISQIRAVTDKPVMINETGSASSTARSPPFLVSSRVHWTTT
jgi:hypothetical protein